MTIDIGRTQAVLKADDNFKDKQFKCGDRIKVYVASVSNRERSGLSVKISRKSQELVKKLLKKKLQRLKMAQLRLWLSQEKQVQELRWL